MSKLTILICSAFLVFAGCVSTQEAKKSARVLNTCEIHKYRASKAKQDEKAILMEDYNRCLENVATEEAAIERNAKRGNIAFSWLIASVGLSAALLIAFLF